MMTTVQLSLMLIHLTTSINISKGDVGTIVEDTQCGVLFSEENFSGSAFVLKDFDQSVNTKKDYRTSISGWQKTRSIQIEENCTMNVCTGTYFQGNCHSFPGGNHKLNQSIASIQSANCTCAKACSCDDIYIPKNPISCGRAYLKGACNICNSGYFPLEYSNSFLDNTERIERIILRTGCNLTVWPGFWKMGRRRVIDGNSATTLEKIRSYECACDDDKFVPLKGPTSCADPLVVELPATQQQLIDILLSNKSAVKHPGLQAALTSCKNGRSSRNAYILLIGSPDVESIGLFGCSVQKLDIGECHIPVDLDHFGVSKSHLRVIFANVAPDDDADRQENLGHYPRDGKWMANLASYLSNHEDLQDSIPNAVIVYHEPMNDDSIAEDGSRFQRKLSILNSLRQLVLDEQYSNVVFMLSSLEHLTLSESKNPEETITKFERVIQEKWAFPKPTFIVPTSQPETRLMINGYLKIENGEYQFRNLLESLKLISKKSGDPLGHAIFSAAYHVEKQILGVMHYYQTMNSSYMQNIVKFKRSLQAETQELIAYFENINNYVVNETIRFSQLNMFLNIKDSEAQEFKIFEERMRNLVVKMDEKMERMVAQDKLARRREIENLKKEIWGKIRIDLDQMFD